MLCWLGHTWEPWEQYKYYYRVLVITNGKEYDREEIRQRRKCRLCGKMQDERVRP